MVQPNNFFFGADEPDSEVPAILPVPEIYKEIWLMLTYIKLFFCERACSSVVALAVASLPTRVRSPAGTTCGVAPGIISPERTGHCVGRVCVRLRECVCVPR